MEQFQQLQYQRPDLSKVKQEIKDYMEALKNAPDYKTAKELFLNYKQSTKARMTMTSIASIRNTINTKDTFYEEEMEYFHKELPKLSLLQKEANEILLTSPFRFQFEQDFGTIFIKNLENQKQFADERIIQFQIEQSQLCQKYSKISANATTTFQGKECNFYGLLKGMQNPDREIRKKAFEAWANLYQSISNELDEVYDGLVSIRNQMAKTLGFASYTEMAYLQRRRFDYTAKDVAAFRKQVIETIVPACTKLYEEQAKRLGIHKLHYYDEALVYPDGNAIPKGTTKELVAKAQKMYREISKETGEFFDFMVEHQLFDLESKQGKRPGGYCTSLALYKAPFIFSNFNGTSADVDVLTHEAGHAFEYFTASRIMPITDTISSTSEINEIHSMTMEHFAYPWMELFFQDKADKYRYAHLAQTLEVIPYMVCVDEFQHKVYENPAMTSKERRIIWHELEQIYMPWRDYDGNTFLEEGGFWMQKQHIFLYPFYYIEYALAQMGAFEFYDRMKHNFTEAWNDYYRLCQAGGSKGYFALLEIANLRNPFQEGSVKAAVEGVIDELFSK